MLEVWKDINFIRNGIEYDYTGYYQVSNYGLVKNYKTGKILSNVLSKKEHYISVTLCKDANCKTFRPHNLVLIMFIPNPENKPEGNHINGIKTDNRVENLEWATRKENAYHAYDLGLCDRNFLRNITKRKAFKVLMMSLDYQSLLWFDSAKEASDATGVCARNINQVCNKKQGRKQAGGYRWKFVDTNA